MHRRLLLSLAALAAAPGIARAAGGGEKKKSGGGSYVALGTVLGTTIRRDGRRGVLSVECGLDTPDSTLRERVEQSVPRLRAAYAQTVRAYAAGLGFGDLPNVDYIARQLQQQTDRVLGRPGARLLLGAVVVN
ncbi:MAG: hypothetical protein ACOY5Y_00565 [Pseudomonadota bacterium]